MILRIGTALAGVVFHLRTGHRGCASRLRDMSKKITIEFDEDDAEEILEIIRQLLERTEENGKKRKTEEH